MDKKVLVNCIMELKGRFPKLTTLMAKNIATDSYVWANVYTEKNSVFDCGDVETDSHNDYYVLRGFNEYEYEIMFEPIKSTTGIRIVDLINDATSIEHDGDCLIIIKETFSRDGKRCYECEKIAELKQNRSAEFDGMLLSHGGAAFRGERDIIDILTCLDNVTKHPEWEICCSHGSQCIGPMGVFCTGENMVVSNRDLHSKINRLGERTFDLDYYRDYLIQSKDQYDLSVWDHTEHIVRNVKVHSVWIKSWAIGDSPECLMTEEAYNGFSKNLFEISGINIVLVDSRY